jgi:competence protein ComFC
MPEPDFMVRPAYRLYRLAWTSLDWVYPPRCGGCGMSGSRFCLNCLQATRIIHPPVCIICGRSQKSPGICRNCQRTPPGFTAMRSWASFSGPLRNAMHRLKYKRDVALADTLAQPLIHLLASTDWKIDLVTAVPASVARQAERGYNQAALLARPIALSHGLPLRLGALSKLRETRSQVGLSAWERMQNVKNAFRADMGSVHGKRVLLVDDVATSGATVSACAQALSQSGAQQVFVLTLAHAEGSGVNRVESY